MNAKPTPLDEDGQPSRPLFADRVADRLVAELLGVCKGLIADGVVTEGEAAGLRRWLQGNPDALIGYPGKVLADRIVRIFRDGFADEEERRELLDLMRDLTGDTPELDQPMNLTATTFYDDPMPTVLFDGQEYVFTGRMLYGSRLQCEQAVTDRGGRVGKNVTKRTGFVVVGPMGSAAWLQSTHGLKLLDAARLREKGAPIKIIPEDHWIQALEWGA